VGIKCSDGVVIGADSAATLGTAFGENTVIQPVSKLHVLQDRMICALSGPVGLDQLYSARIEDLWKNNQLGHGITLPHAMRLIRDAIAADANVVIQGAAASAPFMGNASRLSAVSYTLIALPVAGKSELIQCNYQGSPEATVDIPYVTIGSGQHLADPFLAFIRRIFWPEGLLKLSEGVFATVWTLQHAISVTPGGVGPPIRIATLSFNGQTPVARAWRNDEVDEHLQHVNDLENYIGDFSKATMASPPPPEPPQQ